MNKEQEQEHKQELPERTPEKIAPSYSHVALVSSCIFSFFLFGLPSVLSILTGYFAYKFSNKHLFTLLIFMLSWTVSDFESATFILFTVFLYYFAYYYQTFVPQFSDNLTKTCRDLDVRIENNKEHVCVKALITFVSVCDTCVNFVSNKYNLISVGIYNKAEEYNIPQYLQKADIYLSDMAEQFQTFSLKYIKPYSDKLIDILKINTEQESASVPMGNSQDFQDFQKALNKLPPPTENDMRKMEEIFSKLPPPTEKEIEQFKIIMENLSR